MRISQNNTALLEQYLEKRLSPQDRILFESRLLVDRELNRDLSSQKETYRMLKFYHREKIREELEILHREIFNNPDHIEFQKSILKFFR